MAVQSARYDGHADWYEDWNLPGAERTAERVVELLGPGEGLCLDLGCGGGLDVLLAAAKVGPVSIRLVDLFVGAKYPCGPLDDHAPAFSDTVPVGLEQHLVVDSSADQFGALRRTEKHGAVLDHEVDRKDRWFCLDAGDESPERDTREQIPALLLRKYGDRLRLD